MPEEAACETCSFKTSCIEVNKPGTGRGNAADLYRFLYTWALESPQEEKDLNSLSILLESFPEFIKKINNDSVSVKPEQENQVKNFKRTKKFEGMEEAGVEGEVEGEEKGGGRIRRVRDLDGTGEDNELMGAVDPDEMDEGGEMKSGKFREDNHFIRKRKFGEGFEGRKQKEFRSSNHLNSSSGFRNNLGFQKQQILQRF